MPFNGSGIYNLPVTTVTPAVSGTTIDDAEFNTFTADLKSALTNCIVKDGQTVSPTLTTPSIVTPTISGSPLFTGNTVISKASPSLTIRCADEATENTVLQFQDELVNNRALIYRPAGVNALGIDARNALGVPQAAMLITEAGDVSITVGTFKATSAALTTPTLTTPTLTSPVINTGVSGTAGVSRMIQETAVATTSGTTVDFTSIPSWVKKITIMLFEVGTSGTDDLILRVGDSGGIEISGYNGTVAGVSTAGAGSGANATSYFPIGQIDSATNEANGNLTLCLQDDTNHNWCSNGLVAINGTSTDVFMSAGSKSIDTALTTVRISTVGGTDTFDNGSINIIYEG